MELVKRYWIEIAIMVLLTLSLWALLSIQIGLIPVIKVDWSPTFCDKLNNLYLNLSYTFIAGLIVYLFTSRLPFFQAQRKLKTIMRTKIGIIVRNIDDVVLEFSRDVNTPTRTEDNDLHVILNSKVWTNIIPMLKEVNDLNISYISYYYLKSESAKKLVMELIQTYKEYMTIEQISSLEKWCNNQSFHDAGFWHSIPRKNLESPNGKAYLVNGFCKMYSEMKRIAQLF